jgi:cell division protein ZapA
VTANTAHTVQIYLLGKEYQISCTEEQIPELKLAARQLDQKMRNIRDTGKVIGLERIAIMTALNLSHELVAGQSDDDKKLIEQEERLNLLNKKLHSALNHFKPSRI